MHESEMPSAKLGQGAEDPPDEVIDGESLGEPPQEAMFYVSLGEEHLKRNVPLLNEFLKQLVTLSTALIGGGMFFLKDTPLMSPAVKKLIMACFLVSLFVSLIGAIPYSARMNIHDPWGIKRAVERAIWWKRILAIASSGCLLLGLVIVYVAVFLCHS